MAILAVSAVCAGYAWRAGAAANGAAGSGQAAGTGGLERAIAAEKADAATWFAYSRALAARGEFKFAADACRRVLTTEPYHTDAQWDLALYLARASNGDQLHTYLDNLVLSNAKRTLAIMQSADLSTYLREPRFKKVLAEAQSQAQD